jgi:hypothetical protein
MFVVGSAKGGDIGMGQGAQPCRLYQLLRGLELGEG